ncbi:nucleoside-diphosphate sugar epimerase/dehydratase [Parendozoicomonas sp. Alg238-R29]|uniref:polysaccharide biosynthesis protein n=1 Tax=Parendozoicomonas sp. Alg238-R29 TaxID=2993446 RepID=UPI00248D49CB|nr:nucleoside-diphosphate sugar epimerase/dehydratase [Parendozoicomonas sp. Alg238-R29]
MRNKLLHLPRRNKRLLTALFDIAAIWGCLWLALAIRLQAVNIQGVLIANHWQTFALVPLCALPFFIRMGLYRAVLRYMGQHSVGVIVRAAIYATALWLLLDFMLGIDELVPRSVPVMYCLLLIATMCATRYIMRSWLLGQSVQSIFKTVANPFPARLAHKGIPIAIYGAGQAGVQLMGALHRGRDYHPVAFLDDDRNLRGQMMGGVPVYHSEQFTLMMENTRAEEVLLALPSLPRSHRRQLVEKIEPFGLPIRTMPGMADLVSGRMKMQDIRDIDIGDVLGREEVKPDQELLEKDIANQVVLVTGAGGSIGSELCRQILKVGPAALILLEHSEFNLYQLDQELQTTIRRLGIKVQLVPVLGSVNDPQRLVDLMSTYGIDTIYHAAAYKHVPIVEHNISQGLRNNVLGTLYTAQAAILCGVKRFVLISTDKAVRPTNVMGASKRLAEMVLQGLSEEKTVSFLHPELFQCADQKIPNNTRFTMVRFGNVLGSSGSVIPLFRKQIRQGGPVTVTHQDINRYFMTIPEAAQLVIQAGAMGEGGDVFVLDMGRPVKIVDLAHRMIHLSGLSVKDTANPDGDIDVVFSGLRPGEKLYEELLIGENVAGTDHPRISRAHEEWLAWGELTDIIEKMLDTTHGHRYQLTRELLLRYVNGFKPSDKVVDWLFHSPSKQIEEDIVA